MTRKQRLDLSPTHVVEIVGHCRLTFKKAEALRRVALQHDHLDERLPALAITKGSPFEAASTSLDSWVFASCMLTVFMRHHLVQ